MSEDLKELNSSIWQLREAINLNTDNIRLLTSGKQLPSENKQGDNTDTDIFAKLNKSIVDFDKTMKNFIKNNSNQKDVFKKLSDSINYTAKQNIKNLFSSRRIESIGELGKGNFTNAFTMFASTIPKLQKLIGAAGPVGMGASLGIAIGKLTLAIDSMNKARLSETVKQLSSNTAEQVFQNAKTIQKVSGKDNTNYSVGIGAYGSHINQPISEEKSKKMALSDMTKQISEYWVKTRKEMKGIINKDIQKQIESLFYSQGAVFKEQNQESIISVAASSQFGKALSFGIEQWIKTALPEINNDLLKDIGNLSPQQINKKRVLSSQNLFLKLKENKYMGEDEALQDTLNFYKQIRKLGFGLDFATNNVNLFSKQLGMGTKTIDEMASFIITAKDYKQDLSSATTTPALLYQQNLLKGSPFLDKLGKYFQEGKFAAVQSTIVNMNDEESQQYYNAVKKAIVNGVKLYSEQYGVDKKTGAGYGKVAEDIAKMYNVSLGGVEMKQFDKIAGSFGIEKALESIDTMVRSNKLNSKMQDEQNAKTKEWITTLGLCVSALNKATNAIDNFGTKAKNALLDIGNDTGKGYVPYKSTINLEEEH